MWLIVAAFSLPLEVQLFHCCSCILYLLGSEKATTGSKLDKKKSSPELCVLSAAVIKASLCLLVLQTEDCGTENVILRIPLNCRHLVILYFSKTSCMCNLSDWKHPELIKRDTVIARQVSVLCLVHIVFFQRHHINVQYLTKD